MKSKYIKLGISVAAIALLNSACTDLREDMYSNMSKDKFYKNKKEVEAGVFRAYTQAGQTWDAPVGNLGSYFMLNELSADQVAWPQKGSDGYDSGNWMRMHYHTWSPMETPMATAWKNMFQGLGFCNDALDALNNRSATQMGLTDTEKKQYIAELRAYRAYHYLKIMDIWGNVPIAEAPYTPQSPATNTRLEVFNFIEKELLESIPDLPPLDQQHVGRMTKAGAYATLASLYLNAQVYTSTPQQPGVARWQDCINACNAIIDGKAGSQKGAGQPPTLDDNVKTPFCLTNSSTSNENLFTIHFKYPYITFQFWNWFYHYDQKKATGGEYWANNCMVAVPGVYGSYSDDDARKQAWLNIGTQYIYGKEHKPGNEVICSAGREYNGEPLVFVDNIRKNKLGLTQSDMTQGEENSGVRCDKFVTGPRTDGNYESSDYVIYRLAEIYFDRAECELRLGQAGQAVQDVNECLMRAYGSKFAAHQYTTATLTMDALLAERGREFVFEGKRRTDLIRFDKFDKGGWWDFQGPGWTSTSGQTTPTDADGHLHIFPIPHEQLGMNPNLKQNPGYN